MDRLGGLFLLLLCAACTDAEREQSGPSRSHAKGPIVARVQGSPIGLEQVRELALATGLSPREALARLEDAVLLEHDAEQRGYQHAEVVLREGRRALVRALLAQAVEGAARPEDISDADLRARFESQRARLGVSSESYADHVSSLREQLALERRSAALEKLLAELRAATKVSLDETELRKVLADPALWGAGT